MLFERDEEDSSRIWIDRGIDSRLDSFEPCEVCNAIFDAKQTQKRVWHQVEEELCLGCRTDFAVIALASDLAGLPRPFNLDREGSVITNDELNEELKPVAEMNPRYDIHDGQDPYPLCRYEG